MVGISCLPFLLISFQFFRANFYFHGFQFLLQAWLSFQADCWSSKSKFYNIADRFSATGVILCGPVRTHKSCELFRFSFVFCFSFFFFCKSHSSLEKQEDILILTERFFCYFLTSFQKTRVILFPIAGMAFKLQAFVCLLTSGFVLAWSRKSKCQKEYALRHTLWHIIGFLSVYLYADRVMYNRTYDPYWPFEKKFWNFGPGMPV